MENGVEFSSPCISNGSSSIPIASYAGHDEGSNNLQLLSLSRLSSGLEKLLIDPGEYEDYNDADIEVEGILVGVNRGILAARSQFFHEEFKKAKKDCDGKPKFLMTELVPCGWVGYEAFMVFLNYVYTGKTKASPPEVSTCVDESCDHYACRPAIDYAVQLMYASATFQIKELVMLIQRHLDWLVDIAAIEDVIPILLVGFRCSLAPLVERCVRRVTSSNLDNFTLENELPGAISSDIKARRLNQQGANEKKIRKILRALDCNDVELVKLLLEESDITLDDAYAVHYAAAYCNSKVVNEVLGLGKVDLNLRNARGYTVLHVAARRKDPAIIVAILDKSGASIRDATCSNGHTAVTICRRSTRPKDYNKTTEEGEEKNNDRLCIDVLEGVMMNGNPVSLPSSTTLENDLVMELYFLENRVALARRLYPREARINMEIAHADSTLEFVGLSGMEGLCGNLKGVGLTGLPPDQVKRLMERREALKKTVELGRRFFRNCSDVLDKLTADDVLDSLESLESGTPEEQTNKKRRYMELKEEVMKAFDKDMAQNRVGLSSCSSSSTSPKMSATSKVRKKIK
ncbi:PREDICTED: BTB/POZ domain and ankyrin repeat-containing protein NPR2-like [Ipomoea nil]|uniref:BTB/POZ domain and ankyrin repeat-containing protein NPR2-like n=1 Tax=Ipomoea nil TaxID=35883 RepID=UPI000900B09F|nr:PREDICTED: BTB/POZ domain and ankyrin repeat-containing protein NPR2-like [Ipomoea nil]